MSDAPLTEAGARPLVARGVCAMVGGYERTEQVMDTVVRPLLARVQQAERALAGHLFDGESLSTREAIRNELIEQALAARAALADIRDRHRRHGDRCGACEQKSQLSADSCDACGFGSKHPCETRRIAERAESDHPGYVVLPADVPHGCHFGPDGNESCPVCGAEAPGWERKLRKLLLVAPDRPGHRAVKGRPDGE